MGAGVALAVDPPDPNFRTLQPADFSPARFEPKRRELIRCRLLSRRLRSRLSTGCREINELLREWLRDTNEFAWLYRALGVSANRWNTARASAAQLSSEELNRILSLHHAAARVYVGQATKVLERRASTGRLLRTYIRGTALDLKFSRRFRAKALARFSRLEGVPQSTQLDLARAGLDVPGAVEWVTKRMRSEDLPSSLSALLAAAPRVADSSDLRFSGLSRSQQVSLLQAWLGERAHGLSGECGYSLTTAITNIVRDLPESYAGTLAEHVNQSSDATGRCIFAPNLPEAREGYVKGPRQLLVKSAVDTTGGLETAQDIHVSPRGELLAVDETAHLIRRFTLDGSPIGTFGSGTLEQPVQATTDSTGAVFVSDWTPWTGACRGSWRSAAGAHTGAGWCSRPQSRRRRVPQ